MALMLLSSYERARRVLAADGQDPLTDNAKNKRQILEWLPVVSAKVEKYCNRCFHSESRTEYFDVDYGKTEFYVAAPPITTLTSVYTDSSGLWEGAEGAEDDYYISAQSAAVNLDWPKTWMARKGLRIIYTGGMGTNAVQSVYATTGASGSFTIGRQVQGGTSGALGIIRAWASPALTVEVIYGIFEAAETLTEYTGTVDSATGGTSSAVTATLSSKTTTSMAEAYPDIVRAVELEMRFMFKHRLDFENIGTNQDGTTLRRDNATGQRIPLTPEACDLLNPYRMLVI